MKFAMFKFFVVGFMMFAATNAWADSQFDFSINTASFAGQSGYIEFQFNGDMASDAGSAVITKFSSDASILAPPILSGGASGTLSTTAVTIVPSDVFNDYFQSLTFGNNISFELKLSGGSGNSFGLLLWNSNVSPLQPLTDEEGYATRIDLNTGAPPTVSINLVQPSPVPVPSPFWLLCTSLMGLLILRRIAKNPV